MWALSSPLSDCNCTFHRNPSRLISKPLKHLVLALVPWVFTCQLPTQRQVLQRKLKIRENRKVIPRHRNFSYLKRTISSKKKKSFNFVQWKFFARFVSIPSLHVYKLCVRKTLHMCGNFIIYDSRQRESRCHVYRSRVCEGWEREFQISI